MLHFHPKIQISFGDFYCVCHSPILPKKIPGVVQMVVPTILIFAVKTLYAASKSIFHLGLYSSFLNLKGRDVFPVHVDSSFL